MSQTCADESMLGNDVIAKRGDGTSSEQFTLLGTVTDLSGPNKKKDIKENTKRGQNWKTFFGTLRDAGEVKMKIKSKPGHADFERLNADFNNDDCPRNYQIVYGYANILYNNGIYEEAVKHYEEVIKLKP